MFKRNQNGFTLIELMIVIAIIGVLAAIAIPQLTAYRIRSFNSSALSDTRNIATTEAAFFADWQSFGVSNSAGSGPAPDWPASDGGDGEILTGPYGSGTAGDIPGIVITTPGGNKGTQISLGNSVMLIANTNSELSNATFTAVAKHQKGDTYFGADSEVTAIYMCKVEDDAGEELTGGIDTTDLEDNFNGADIDGEPWVMK